MKDQQKRKIDAGDWELPETLFIRDIEDRVFQGIVLQCLQNVEGIQLVGSTFIDSIFGREGGDRLKGIHVSQDNKNHSVSVKVEVSIAYGIPIPSKAEEIQIKIAHEITEQTGLHVSCVHVVFRSVVMPQGKSEKAHQPIFIEAKSN